MCVRASGPRRRAACPPDFPCWLTSRVTPQFAFFGGPFPAKSPPMQADSSRVSIVGSSPPAGDRGCGLRSAGQARGIGEGELRPCSSGKPNDPRDKPAGIPSADRQSPTGDVYNNEGHAGGIYQLQTCMCDAPRQTGRLIRERCCGPPRDRRSKTPRRFIKRPSHHRAATERQERFSRRLDDWSRRHMQHRGNAAAAAGGPGASTLKYENPKSTGVQLSETGLVLRRTASRPNVVWDRPRTM